MYDVTITNENITQVIHDHRTAKSTEKLIKGEIADQANAISSFSFEIYPNNAGYKNIEAYSTKLKVYNTQKNRYDFVGRVLQIIPQMDNNGVVCKEVVCEDRKGYLQDTIQPYTEEKQYAGDETRNGLQEFIDVILGNHNSQVEDEKKIYRGNVTVTTFESSEGVYKGLNYETTWDCITNKLIKSFGGQIQLREEAGLLYLDYADQLGTTRATTIELAKNMKSAKREIDPTNIITRLIPLGAKLSIITTDENGKQTTKETEERLTIASVNGGLIYVQDDIAYEEYGAIYGTYELNDVTDASNLKTKAEAYLSANNYLDISNNITALDLSLLGLDIDDFVLYDSYPVKNALIELNDTLTIIKKNTDIIEPQLSSFDMGNTSKSIADTFIDDAAAIKNIDTKVSIVNTDVKNKTNSLLSYVENSFSTITQSANEIKLEVESNKTSITDYESFKTTMKTLLQLNDEGVAMIFESIDTYISEVNGTVQSNYNETLKYIRFIDGDVILGNEENQYTLKLTNEKIAFFNNGVEMGYWQNNKLYVPDEIRISVGGKLVLGNYSYVPRSNGNLSLKYTGGGT